MTDQQWAHEYHLTLPTEAAAREVAELLAARGHLLVAVRVFDHFHLDPDSWWYGKPSLQPEYTGWWDVFSVALDSPDAPDLTDQTESAALTALARRFGGVAAGGGGGHRDTVLSVFPRVGLVHEQDEAEAARLRVLALEAEPVREQRSVPSAPPLTCGGERDGREQVLVIAEHVRAQLGPEGDEFADCLDDDGLDDVGEVLGDLFNDAMHQGTVYPHTAGMVPLFAALAAEDRLSDRYRAWTLLDLYLFASVGRRDLCETADSAHALGEPRTEAMEALDARAAVATALPALAPRWADESELGRFFLAALAAACPESAGPLKAAMAGLALPAQGTHRASTVRLMDGLARGDDAAIAAALDEIDAWHPEMAYRYDSPHATAEQRGLCVLEELLIEELDG